MLNRTSWALAWALGIISTHASDILHLKGDAAIIGKILANKPDQVVVDIGYTVLVVPREQVVEATTADSTGEAETVKGLPTKELSTQELANSELSTKELPTKVMEAKALLTSALAKASAARAPEKAGMFQAGDGSRPEGTVRQLVSSLGEAVVQVRTPSGLGSGFIIHEDGYLITNFHVIENETQISVEVYHQKDGQLDRRSYKQVRIVAMNKYADLVLLKIEDRDAPKFVAVPLGDSDELGVGERVFAIGSPLGLERTVTEGIVSTTTRPMQGELYLQTTTQINPGNSGGPLFDLRGEVVGVTNMKIAFGEGLGFAIPIDSVKSFLNHRDAFAYDNDNPSSPYRYLEPPSRMSKLGPPR